MKIVLFLLFVFFAFLGGLVYLRLRENRFLKKKVSETMDPHLLEAIKAEDADAERRRQEFEKALTKYRAI